MNKKIYFRCLFLVLMVTGCMNNQEPTGILLLNDSIGDRFIFKLLNIETKEITEIADGWDGSISPNGKILAFSGEGSANPPILPKLFTYTFGIDTEPVQITEPGAYDPTWSPDGEWIAYSSASGGWLYLIRKDGSENRLIYEYPDYYAYPYAWSQDGQYIIISRSRGPEDDWQWSDYTIKVETGDLEKIDEFPPLFGVEISPDGRYRITNSNQGVGDDVHRILIMDLETGEERPLINDPETSSGRLEFNGVWSPDGNWIAVDVDGKICIVDTDGELYDCYSEPWEYSLQDWGP